MTEDYSYQIAPHNDCVVQVRETYSTNLWRNYMTCDSPDRALYILQMLQASEQQRLLQEMAEEVTK